MLACKIQADVCLIKQSRMLNIILAYSWGSVLAPRSWLLDSNHFKKEKFVVKTFNGIYWKIQSDEKSLSLELLIIKET